MAPTGTYCRCGQRLTEDGRYEPTTITYAILHDASYVDSEEILKELKALRKENAQLKQEVFLLRRRK